MMRKSLVCLVMILLLLLLCGTAMACVFNAECTNKETYDYQYETESFHKKTCYYCGCLLFEEHFSNDRATCIDGAYCPCGALVSPATGHSWDYESNGDATCTTDGTKTAKCDRCDETDTVTDEGSALGHSFTHYVSNNDATCTTDGTKTAKCDRCDETDTVTDTGTALGHSYEVVSQTPPTCTTNGCVIYACINCNDTYQEKRPALSHWYGEWTYNDNGTHSAACKRGCKHRSTTDCALFTYKLASEGATEPEVFVFCPVCGHVENGEVLPILENVRADGAVPRGEPILRMGTLPNGMQVLIVGFEYAGKLTQSKGRVRIYLPSELLDGYSLSLLDADGTQTDLPYEMNSGSAYFDLDFASVDADGALIPIRVICLTKVE